MQRTFLLCAVSLMLAGLCVAPVSAEVKHDTFNGVWVGDNEFNGGGGTGWNSGEWIYYDQTDWWNQWFYNDPPDPTRWKEITYDIGVSAMPDMAAIDSWGTVDIALNWSTVDFPETGPVGPPPMPTEEQYIERAIIFTEPISPGMWDEFAFGDFDILTHNPEWVSIDVRVDAWQEVPGAEPGEYVTIEMPVMVDGQIWHECVPEPASLSLLVLGGIALLRRKRK